MKPVMSGSTFICVLLALLAACSPTGMAGNGSEITNGVVACEAGPADSALVIAFPAAYIPCAENPVMPETTYTDANGAFRMSLADAQWNLLIYDRTRQLGAFAERRKGGPAMGVIELDNLGAVAGTAATLPIDALKTAYIGIAGSPFFTKVVKDSSFLISRVPPCTYKISLWMIDSHSSTDQPIPVIGSVIAGATVMPGMTTTILVNH